MFTTFKGRAKRLDDIDLPRIGQKIGVGEDELHAFMDVETAGDGFDKHGRPKMLFEPHIFYRQLSGSKRNQAVRQGLAYKKWGTKRYPRDSYPRLKEAMEIDETAALKSASWGLGQILGTNHAIVGYPTVQAMIKAFMDDEETHLEAIVNFLVANNLDDDLRRHDWRGVARGYNGPSYAKHNYHGRMAAAFRKWQRIPDTPFNFRKTTFLDPTDVRVQRAGMYDPVETVLDEEDKPFYKSTENIATMVGSGTSALAALSYLPQVLGILVFLTVVVVAGYIFWRRHRRAEKAREAKEVYY